MIDIQNDVRLCGLALKLKVMAANRESSAVLMAVRPKTPMKMPSTTSSVRPLRRVTSANDLRRLALMNRPITPPPPRG